MKNLNEIKNRYLREPFNRQLGHLASDLLRIATFLDHPKNMAAIIDIIEESKFFAEWAAPDAPLHIQELLSEIQPKLALWQYHILNKKDNPKEKAELTRNTKEWSSRLIELSGLSVK